MIAISVETCAAIRRYCEHRIAVCERQELKFGLAWKPTRLGQPPQSLIEAWTERQAMEAILRILEGDRGPLHEGKP